MLNPFELFSTGFGAFEYGFAIFGLVLLGIGYYVIGKAREEESTLYKIQRLPPVELEDAVEGVPVKTYGKIICQTPNKSPYTGKDCVWSRSITERYSETADRKGRRSGHWVKVEDKVKSTNFQIDDGTGKIGVDLEGAALDYIYPTSVLEEMGMRINGSRRRKEYIIPVGNAFVFGLSFKDGKSLIVRKSDREPVALSVRKETEFYKSKRADDKFVNALGYGMAVLGGGILLFSIFG